MTGPLTERVSAPVPAGLIGMLVLVVAIEQLGMHNNPAFQSFHAATWRYSSTHVESKSRGRDILCFGDSMVKFGVMPPIIRERTGRSAFNFATTVGAAPASYFLFRRAIEAGARPRAVVVDFLGGLLQEGPNSEVSVYPWGDLLRVGEAFDLAWTARDPTLFARAMLARMLHSYKDRYEIRAYVQNLIRRQNNHQAMVLAISHRNWNQNLGAQAQRKAKFEDLPPPPKGPHRQGHWVPDPVNESYVRRFLALAAEREIAVYWLIPPFSPMYQAHLDHSGNEDRYDHFVKKQQADFPNVLVVDARRQGLDCSYFFDTRHLDRDGASALSTSLGDVIRRRQAGRLDGLEWLTLAPSAERPIAVAVEDTEESHWHLRTRMTRRRR